MDGSGDRPNFSRRKVLALSSAATAGLAGLGRAGAQQDDPVGTMDYGPAAPTVTLLDNDGIGRFSYHTTFNMQPTMVGAFDIYDREFKETYELPEGDGSWATTTVGDDLYVGTYDFSSHANLIRVDTETDDVSVVEEITEDYYTWNAETSPDGNVYVSTYPTCRVIEYDPETDTSRSFGPLSDEDYGRCVAAGAETVYAGIGTSADLVAIDRSTGDWEHILPTEFEDATSVYQAGLTSSKLVIYLRPGGIYLIDRDDYSQYRELQVPNATPFGFFTIHDDKIYLPSFRETDDGSTTYPMFRHDPETGTTEELFSNYRGAAWSSAYIHDSRIVTGYLGTVDVANWETGEYHLVNALEAGMQPGSERPQQIATWKQNPVAASRAAIFYHDEPSSPPDRRSTAGDPQNRDLAVDTSLAGEQKAMTSVGETLYMANYPGATLTAYDSTGSVTRLATIGHEQNRPRDIHYQPQTKTLLVGTTPNYGAHGGAVAAYDLESDELVVDRNVIQDQSIFSVTAIDDVAYLGSSIHGGGGTRPRADEAVLATWDPETQTKQWQLKPASNVGRIYDLVVADERIFGITDTAELFVVDPGSRSTVHTASVAGAGALTVGQDGYIYGVLGSDITRIDPETFETDRFSTEEDYFSSMIAGDRAGHLYVADRDTYSLWEIEIKD